MLCAPILMRQGLGVELVTNDPPMRKHPVQKGHELLCVVALKEVGQLMDDHVFETLRRLLDQFEVQLDSTCFDIAGAPFGLHPLDAPVRRCDTVFRRPALN